MGGGGCSAGLLVAGVWGPGAGPVAVGSQRPVPLLPSSPLLLQGGAGSPGSALLLASNQFFLLWGPTAAPRPTATTAAATAAATTIHRSHWAKRSYLVTVPWTVCAPCAPRLTLRSTLHQQAKGPCSLTPNMTLPLLVPTPGLGPCWPLWQGHTSSDPGPPPSFSPCRSLLEPNSLHRPSRWKTAILHFYSLPCFPLQRLSATGNDPLTDLLACLLSVSTM